ncbi:hypothetical protein F5144DRAFT_614480 [Chaetomium tenue]|uniref:Uncharacterized protein n=1 Tax=Chaetomium tenue TaxID=1854479 RepID=A0ACB7P4T0_9PEZI|nr:hypothetical protein F5144DRAFT_614480 [Chaetomium globosum]
MVGVPDEALERRRAQNRIAQRRFRQKRQGNRNAEENRQSQESTFPLPVFPEATGLDVCFEDFVLSPGHTPTSSVSIQCPRTQPSNLVTSTMFSELEREFARGSTVASIQVSGTASEATVAAETPVVQLGSPCQPEREASVENAAVIRLETLEHSPGTLSLLGQSAARSTSSSSSSSNGSGWLGALHMAAKRGHSGIMRFLLQQNIDINERDSDGLTALMGHD